MRSTWLNSMKQQIDRGAYFQINVVGAMMHTVYVDDVSSAVEHCINAKHDKTKIYNVANDVDLREFEAKLAINSKNKIPSIKVPFALAKVIAATFGQIPNFPLTKKRLVKDKFC